MKLWDWEKVKETDFGDRMDGVQMNDENLFLMFEGGSPQVLQAMLGEESSIDDWLHLPWLGKWIARVAVVPLRILCLQLACLMVSKTPVFHADSCYSVGQVPIALRDYNPTSQHPLLALRPCSFRLLRRYSLRLIAMGEILKWNGSETVINCDSESLYLNQMLYRWGTWPGSRSSFPSKI